MQAFFRVSAVLLASVLAACAQSTTTVTPAESGEILYNPGMGFADFMHNWGAPAPTLDKYPTPRVAYFRWYWSELEPSQGQFNFALVDKVIAAARARNQDLAFRIMPDVPAWLGAQGVKQIGSTNNWVVDHNNPLFLSLHERLVAAFGARYSGSPNVDHVDIGSVGCWGEWNSACCPAGQSALCQQYMPTDANKRLIANWYYRYFPKTPLVALAEGTGYANTIGAGWRGDCFGDYGMFSKYWNHMAYLYPEIAQKPEVVNSWRSAPVQFEACGTMQDWYNRGFNIDLILQKGLDWHMSVFNGKNSAVPAAWRAKVDAWLKKIGYRFVLTRLVHTNDITPGGQLRLQGFWTNKGVAPAYRPWPLAYRLRNSAGTVVAQWKSSTDVRKWLPGSVSTDDTVQTPATLAAGTYALDVAILREDSSAAYVQLAIAGKRPDLWYQISQVRVRSTTATADPATTPAPAPAPAPAPTASKAAFVRIDTATKGNWKGVYGTEGYNIAQHAIKLPAYVTSAVSGDTPMLWAASTTDTRALLKTNSTDRVAACWYSGGAFNVALAFNDSNPHQVALYLLDWPRYKRTQKIEILDKNGVVLDSRTASGFTEGQYLVWNLTGSVVIRITGIGANGVLSGIFFR